jgi:hypothetical protein
MSTAKALVVAALLASLVVSAPARAGDAETAAAISAFDEAAALLASGETAAACAKFAQSYELDPQLGSLLHLADCREQSGALASAWLAFREAAEWAAKVRDERQSTAERRAAALEPRLAKLRLVLPADLPPGTVVTRAGERVPRAMWQTMVPLDPGSYELSVTAAGYEVWSREVEIKGEGGVQDVVVPSLVPVAEATATAAPSDGGLPPPASAQERSLLSRKWPALAALGVGVAGAVVGIVFSAESLNAKAQADELCGPGELCIDSSGPTDVDLRQKAWDAGTGATVGAVVAGVGFAAAGVLWLVLPGPDETERTASARVGHLRRPSELRVGVTLGGLSLRGRF